MIRSGALLAFLLFLFAPTSARAVVVEIDISTEGEPVPGTTITFETEEGEEIPPVELTELTEDPGTPSQTETPPESETPAVGVPASSAGTKDETPAEQTETTETTSGSGFKVELPDALVGKGLVVVVRKDDTLIKREPVTLDEDSTDIAIEAYDPADAGLGIEISQPKQCERGKPCDYEISMTNEGNGMYTGPLFLSGKLTGTVAEPASEMEWRCGPAGGGKQFCLTYALLEPGASQTWTVPAQLPGRISQGTENCLEIRNLDEGPDGRSEPLVQALQAGLAANGISTGKPDGIAGPATKAAIAKYVESTALDPSADHAVVFENLFGLSPARLARLDLATPKDCEKLDLKPLPKTVKTEPTKKTTSKKSGTTSKTSSRKTTKTSTQKQERRKRALGTAIGVGVGIGLGAATRGSSKGGKHDRY